MKISRPSIKIIEDLEKLPLESRFEALTSYDVLKTSAVKWPSRRALIFLPQGNPLGAPKVVTYKQLFDTVTRVANLLKSFGITAGKAVSTILPNSPENYFLYFAAQAVGIFNPISPKLPPEQMADLLQTAESDILITMGPQANPQMWDAILQLRKLCPGLKKILVLDEYQDPEQNIESFHALLATQPLAPLFNEREINPKAVSSYFHTSGTVASPKLVQHTHRGSLHAAWAAGVFVPYQKDNAVVLSGLPMFHVSGSNVETLSALLYGATVVVMSPQGWGDPSIIPYFWKIVERYKGTCMAAVPPIYKALIGVPLKGEDLSSLEFAVSGNVPICKEDSDAFCSLTGVRVSTLWGQTEVILGCINPAPDPRQETFGAAGLRLPYLQMKVLNHDLQVCRPHDPGVLYIKGPTVGTYKREDLNHQAYLTEVWMNTGDIAYQDNNQYIWILGRQSDYIFCDEKYISLVKIETTLEENPFIKKAALIHVPDENSGEKVHAFLMVDPQIEAHPSPFIQNIQSLLQIEIGDLPLEINLCNTLPFNAMGKVMKYRLREELEADRDSPEPVSVHHVA